METIFMNKENSKRSEPHKFVLSLLQRLDLRSSENMFLFKLFLLITRGKI